GSNAEDHYEFDQDWLAAGYCGAGVPPCDNSTLHQYLSTGSISLDVQRFIFWDSIDTPGHWSIHPISARKLDGTPPPQPQPVSDRFLSTVHSRDNWPIVRSRRRQDQLYCNGFGRQFTILLQLELWRWNCQCRRRLNKSERAVPHLHEDRNVHSQSQRHRLYRQDCNSHFDGRHLNHDSPVERLSQRPRLRKPWQFSDNLSDRHRRFDAV